MKRQPLAERLFDFLFTRQCVFCGEVLKLFKEGHVCEVCGDELHKIENQSYAADNITELKALYEYTGIVRKGVFDFKYHNITALGDYSAQCFAQLLEAELKEKSIDLITFVPAYSLKEGRIYNQSEYLAKKLSYYIDIPCEVLLMKKRNAKSQTACSSIKERIENAKNLYTVTDRDLIAKKSILIVDDVLTTGSTLSSCAEALLSAGAVKIYAAVIAKTFKHRQKIPELYLQPEPEVKVIKPSYKINSAFLMRAYAQRRALTSKFIKFFKK